MLVPEASPMFGAVRVGLLERTTAPDAVDVVPPVPPLATGRTPVTPLERGSPVRLVATPELGVPSAGAVRLGLFERTTEPVPVDVVPPVPPFATGRTPVTPLESGSPVKLVATPELGVPSAGVVNEGDVET